MDYDIAVIGGGPAVAYLQRLLPAKGRKVVLFEATVSAPVCVVWRRLQIMGIPDISGTALMDIFCKSSQADGSRYH